MGILVKQLKSPKVAHIFEILHEGGSQIGERFTSFEDSLLKDYALVRDNKKFLSTILWHLKVIMHLKEFVRC